MNQISTTSERLIKRLYQQIQEHPNKDEVMSLALAQLLDDDDTPFAGQETIEAL